VLSKSVHSPRFCEWLFHISFIGDKTSKHLLPVSAKNLAVITHCMGFRWLQTLFLTLQNSERQSRENDTGSRSQTAFNYSFLSSFQKTVENSSSLWHWLFKTTDPWFIYNYTLHHVLSVASYSHVQSPNHYVHQLWAATTLLQHYGKHQACTISLIGLVSWSARHTEISCNPKKYHKFWSDENESSAIKASLS